VNRLREEGGVSVAHVHLRHLNPLPSNLEGILRSYRRVLVPELNLGQLAQLLRARFLLDIKTLSKVQGKPFKSSEIADAVTLLAKE
jgi:2-oxoglutarate ferredoxin oxidoreductase subunit alpha